MSGVKGGVGKSTLAVSIAKLLARNGDTVLLVDRDIIGWSSRLLGHEGPSLLHCAASGEEGQFWVTREEGKGRLTAVRINPDPPLFVKDFKVIKEDPSRFNRYVKLYEALLRNHEIVVVDNPPNVFQGDEAVDLEHRAFTNLRRDERWYRVYVSDPSERGISAVLQYMEVLESFTETGRPGALVVNMVPPLPEEAARASSSLRRVCAEKSLPVCAVVPFDERLYTYGSYMELNEFPEQVIALSKALVRLPEKALIE
ncbi:ParA family protein [Sulfodiicoccus acidiphilus]|uniref:ParA family protein n=1 Tax=Sulfodiicoccus acidiphilus TaxID=1670455 RepID=UPI0013153B75|nr:ParA family protein [Sulfodiicoccus acidiphilus]